MRKKSRIRPTKLASRINGTGEDGTVSLIFRGVSWMTLCGVNQRIGKCTEEIPWQGIFITSGLAHRIS